MPSRTCRLQPEERRRLHEDFIRKQPFCEEMEEQ